MSALPWWFSGKESSCQCRKHGFNPEVSLDNCSQVSELLTLVLILIFAADSVFIMAYFGELFSDGAIRNMVAIKTNKMIIYLASLFINSVVCLVMYILVFAALAVSILIAGFYPIIYGPAMVAAVLVGLLVTVAVTSFFTRDVESVSERD